MTATRKSTSSNSWAAPAETVATPAYRQPVRFAVSRASSACCLCRLSDRKLRLDELKEDGGSMILPLRREHSASLVCSTSSAVEQPPSTALAARIRSVVLRNCIDIKLRKVLNRKCTFFRHLSRLQHRDVQEPCVACCQFRPWRRMESQPHAIERS